MDFLNCALKQVLFKSCIDLSATNETFVTKGKIENNFLNITNKEPKLNHWFNTTLKQLVIQFEHSSRCIKKVTFNFTFFLEIVK